MATVFVVDDSDTALVQARQALGGRCRVLTMPSAEKMMQLITRVTPDLILLDVEMPGTDGFAALAGLKRDARYADIPVVFVTGSEDAETARRGLALGAAGCVPKPLDAAALPEGAGALLLANGEGGL